MLTTRRGFIKYSGIFAGSAVLSGSGLLSLKMLTPDEAEAVEKSMESYEVRYTAAAMCPAECGLELWIKDGKIAKVYGNEAVPINDGVACAKCAAMQQLV